MDLPVADSILFYCLWGPGVTKYMNVWIPTKTLFSDHFGKFVTK